MIYLRINSGGMYQPHQCAQGADIAIEGAEGTPVAEVVRIANATCVAAPLSDVPHTVHFSALGHGRFINLYRR